MKKIWLLVDDMRDAMGCDIIARNAKGAREVIAALRNKLECIIFDHDLGESESGYDILKWSLENRLCPKMVHLVTSNPVGLKNMENVLRDHSYYTKNGRVFYRD